MPPRVVPRHRLKELLEAATRIFVAHGYRLSQMSDVARELGVAKGTLYLYVASKEALFAAALLYAAGELPEPDDLPLPLAAPPPGALAERLRQRLAQQVAPPALRAALGRREVGDPRAELESVLRALFETFGRYRTAIKLADRCRDHAELQDLLYQHGRLRQLELLERYLRSRIDKGLLRPVPDVATAARFVLETVTLWAVHVHWDPSPQPLDPNDIEETAVQFLLGGLLPEDRS